jgi:histidinol-phosphatase (PHP family)
MTSPVHPTIRELNLDFVIGSVHFVAPPNGKPVWTVDGPADEFELLVTGHFGGDVRALVERYYRLVAEMAEGATPDIIGHFDLVKKTNRTGRWFSEDAARYRDAVDGALEAVKRSGAIMELNTGGVLRNTSGAFYPSEWILREACRKGVPVMLNADAHAPDHIDGLFAEGTRLLRRVGYRSQRQLTAGGWIDEELGAG